MEVQLVPLSLKCLARVNLEGFANAEVEIEIPIKGELSSRFAKEILTEFASFSAECLLTTRDPDRLVSPQKILLDMKRKLEQRRDVISQRDLP